MKCVIVAVCLSLLCAGRGWAERRIGPFDEKVILRVGNMWSNHDTSLQVSGDKGLGIGINLEDAFDLDDEIANVFQFSVIGRFKQRHRIGVQYYGFNRDSQSTLNQEIPIEDIVVEAGAEANSKLNIQITDVSYQYSFIRDDKHELSGTAGLFWMSLDFEVGFRGMIEGEDGIQEDSAEVDAKLNAPLPVFGLNYGFAATSRWLTQVSFQYFTLRTNLVSGALVKVSADTRYYFWDRFEVGGGLTIFDLNVNVDSGDLKGKVDWSFWGPQLFLGLSLIHI